MPNPRLIDLWYTIPRFSGLATIRGPKDPRDLESACLPYVRRGCNPPRLHNIVMGQSFQRLTDNEGVSAVPSILESDDDRFSYVLRPGGQVDQMVASQCGCQICGTQGRFSRH